MKKNKISLSKLFYNNKFVLAFSILIAVVIWFYVSIYISPSIEQTISNVPITMDLKENVQTGLMPFYDTSATVSVKVTGKKYVVGNLSENDVIVTPKLDFIETPGTYNMNLTAKPRSGLDDIQVLEATPSTLSVLFDKEVSRNFDITAEVISDQLIADGYTEKKRTLSVERVTIKGPESEVEKIDKVVARSKVNKPLTATKPLDTEILILDKEGKTPKFVEMANQDQIIRLTIQVLQRKSLVLQANFGNTPEYFKTHPLKLTYNPANIDVAGSDSTLSQIGTLTLGMIDFKKLTPTNTAFTFEIFPPAGTEFLSDISTAKVTVDMADIAQTTLTLSKDRINVINNASGKNIKVVPDSIGNIRICGLSANIAKLVGSDIQAEIDLSNVSVALGLQQAKLNILIPSYDDCWAVGDYEVEINATE